MDVLSSATAFATLVSLVGQYLSLRSDQRTDEIDAFRDWLLEQRHEDIAALITSNSKTTVAIKALLNSTHEEVSVKLDALTNAMAALVAGVEELSEIRSLIAQARSAEGIGGAGGGGTIYGNRGTIIGGRGGFGGAFGIGGAGGGGNIHGDDGTIIGGDGGSAGTWDGRGGKGAKGPTERFGVPTQMWGYGRGGAGANHPEYDRRLSVLAEIREEYVAKFPEDAPFINAGADCVPVDWVNQRLVERGETWTVLPSESGCLRLPPLASGQGTEEYA